MGEYLQTKLHLEIEMDIIFNQELTSEEEMDLISLRT